MLEWQFGFWQMLALLWISYFLGGFITELRLAIEKKKTVSKIVHIDINIVGNIWFAFEQESKKFLAQSATYEELQKKLGELETDCTYIVEEAKLKALHDEFKNANSI